jgi:hypothetical protein
MGRGHSGSTVLDALLGNAEDTVGVGELVAGMLRYEEPCSCGRTIEECPFWGEVRQRIEGEGGLRWSEAARRIQAQAHLRRFPATLLGSAASTDVLESDAANQAVVEAISSVADVDVIVDSSKELTRALFLAKHDPEARIIHLVRSPHAVLASLAHRIETGRGFSFLRRRYRARALQPLFMAMAAMGWVIGNLLGELIARFAPGRVLRVRYEDLCEDTGETLRKIGEFAGLDLSRVVAAVGSGSRLALGHKLAGNQMLREGSFTFEPGRVAGRSLPRSYGVLASILTWPLLLKYGYTPSGRVR